MSGAGYSGTPLWKKLGLKPGGQLALLNGPRGWRVPELPGGISQRRVSAAAAPGLEARGATDVVLAFYSDLASLRAALPGLAERIHPYGAIWTAWPRRAGGHESDIREEDIREAALPLGLVDVKVAAIDEDWSGLRLVWRRERR